MFSIDKIPNSRTAGSVPNWHCQSKGIWCRKVSSANRKVFSTNRKVFSDNRKVPTPIRKVLIANRKVPSTSRQVPTDNRKVLTSNRRGNTRLMSIIEPNNVTGACIVFGIQTFGFASLHPPHVRVLKLYRFDC